MPSASQRRATDPSTSTSHRRANGPSVSPGDYQKAMLRSLAANPRTLRELQIDVAERIGVSDESPVEAQLDAMVGAGIVQQHGGKYRLSEDGERLAPLVPEPAAS
jgi:predicted transcriptional regulator